MTGILEQVISGLIVAALLELWRVRGERKSRHADGNATTTTKFKNQKVKKGLKSIGNFRMFIRLILAPLIGFFFAAATAGIMESVDNVNIPIESFTAIVLIVFWTIFIWQLISHWGPLNKEY